MQRRRFTYTTTLAERLASESERLKHEAESLPARPEREQLLRRARQAETASHMSDWLKSSGLQPPK